MNTLTNPLARIVSMIAAFAIATLLVAGTGTAYADDTGSAGADKAATQSSGHASGDATAEEPADEDTSQEGTSEETPAADETEAPSDSQATPAAETPAAGTPAGGGTESSSTPQLAPTLEKLATTDAVVALVPCDDSDSDQIIGGFEIDGDECVDLAEDWDGVDTSSDQYAETIDKFVDDGDTSGFQGSSKALTDPLTWSRGPAPNDKSDIERVRVYSQKFGADEDVFSDFAIDRHPDDGGQGGTGTVTYDVEYNQLADVDSNDGTLSVPNRSQGDLWFVFDQQGNNSLDYIAGYKFFDTDQGGCKAVEGGGFWCVLPAAPDFGGDTSDDGSFAEGTLNLSDAFGQDECFTFGVVNVRTRTSNTDTTAFKDYIDPLEAITSNCGSLVIHKRDVDTDALVGGGVYQIVGDPRPDGDGAGIVGYQLCAYDGPDADLADLVASHPELASTDTCDELVADGVADGQIVFDPVTAGDYTVTEIVAPPGYLLNPEPDPGNSEDVTVVDGEPSSVTFANEKEWQLLDITKTATTSHTATYQWGINKQIAPTAAGPWSDGTTPGAPLVKTVDQGGDTKLYYRVIVSQLGIDTSDYVVEGTIHVDNPNDAAVNASIDESLAGCSINGGGDPVSVSVPAGGADYPYTCDLGDDTVAAGTNTATVTWDRSDYPQSVDDVNAAGSFSDDGSAPFDFETPTLEVNETVEVADDHFDFVPDWVITWGDEADGVYESAVYSTDTATATGTCSAVITNTASVAAVQIIPTVAAALPLAQSSESGQVCVRAVVVSPPQPQPHPSVLPNTGGPEASVLAAGLALVLGGGTLVLMDLRRRRRS